MKKTLWALSCTLTLWLAAPAMAAVLDPAGAVPATTESALDARLGNINGHHFDAVYVIDPPGGAVAYAARVFEQRRLTDRDGLIVVDPQSRQIGVHLGDGFRRRGVDAEAIRERIAADFAPKARAGDLAGASVDLAEGLVAASNAPAGGGAGTGGRPTPDFPWWLLLVPIAAGGFLWSRARKGSFGAGGDVAASLAALKRRQGALIERSLRLDEARELAKGQTGARAATLAALDERATSLMADAAAAGERLDEAEADLAAHRPQRAENSLIDLEHQLTLLESRAAATETAYAALDQETGAVSTRVAAARARMQGMRASGPGADALAMLERGLVEAESLAKAGDTEGAHDRAERVDRALDRLEGRRSPTPVPPVAYAELPRVAEELARRTNELDSAYRTLAERGASLGVAGSPLVVGALARARDALDSPPIDPEGARAALAEAQQALKAYHADLEAADDRRASTSANNSVAGGFGYGLPIIMMPPFGGYSGHDAGGVDSGIGSSGGGDWGGGGGDWGGGGSSGGGDW